MLGKYYYILATAYWTRYRWICFMEIKDGNELTYKILNLIQQIKQTFPNRNWKYFQIQNWKHFQNSKLGIPNFNWISENKLEFPI